MSSHTQKYDICSKNLIHNGVDTQGKKHDINSITLFFLKSLQFNSIQFIDIRRYLHSWDFQPIRIFNQF